MFPPARCFACGPDRLHQSHPVFTGEMEDGRQHIRALTRAGPTEGNGPVSMLSQVLAFSLTPKTAAVHLRDVCDMSIIIV